MDYTTYSRLWLVTLRQIGLGCLLIAGLSASYSPSSPAQLSPESNGEATPDGFVFFRPAIVAQSSPLLIVMQQASENPLSGPRNSALLRAVGSLNRAGMAVALAEVPPTRQSVAPNLGHASVKRLVGLLRKSARLGFDTKSIYLVGLGSGARVVVEAMLSITGENDIRPAIPRLAGVLMLGPDVSLLRSDPLPIGSTRWLPPISVLVGEHQAAQIRVGARKWSVEMLAQGAEVTFQVVPGADTLSFIQLQDLPSIARVFLMSSLGIKPLPETLNTLLKLERQWQQPDLTTQVFREAGVVVNNYAMDERLRLLLRRFYFGETFRLAAWALKKYQAIDLIDYLRARFPLGNGRFLVTNNIRGEQFVWDLEQIKDYAPVIVIGLDDETNLFRLNVFYQPLRQNSWAPHEARPPIMTRSLGAFLFFRKKEPKNLVPRYLAQFSLLPDSFVLQDNDPLQPIRFLDVEVLAALTHENGCIACHSWRGMGGKAYHIVARTKLAHGGYALPIEQYQQKVLRRFLFQQGEVAALIGASPNRFSDRVAQKLYALFRPLAQ